jgi:hypothetical protein
MKEYILTERKNLFKIFPWSIKVDDKKVMNLLKYFDNEGFEVELQCYEDRDNGEIPLLWVYDTEVTRIIGDVIDK